MNLQKLVIFSLGILSTGFFLKTHALEEKKISLTVPTLSTEQLLRENVNLRVALTQPPSNPKLLQGKRIALLSTDGVESIELHANIDYFKNRGAKVDLIAPHLSAQDPKYGVRYPAARRTHILTVKFMENADWVKIDRFIDEANPADYDALVIPGGAWGPDSLRIDPNALNFVKKMNENGKFVAAICHGPLVLVNAAILRGKSATSTWNVQEDLKNAGANVRDIPVVIDGKIITSRHPIDLPQFLAAISEALSQ